MKCTRKVCDIGPVGYGKHVPIRCVSDPRNDAWFMRFYGDDIEAWDVPGTHLFQGIYNANSSEHCLLVFCDEHAQQICKEILFRQLKEGGSIGS